MLNIVLEISTFAFLAIVTGSPTGSNVASPTTLLDAVKGKCTSVEAYPNVTQILKQCGTSQNMQNITLTEQVQVQDIKNVLCRLFSDAVSNYCSNLNQVKYSSELPELCEKLPKVLQTSPQLSNLSVVFSNSDICKEICVDTSDERKFMCKFAFYLISVGKPSGKVSVPSETEHDNGAKDAVDTVQTANAGPQSGQSEKAPETVNIKSKVQENGQSNGGNTQNNPSDGKTIVEAPDKVNNLAHLNSNRPGDGGSPLEQKKFKAEVYKKPEEEPAKADNNEADGELQDKNIAGAEEAILNQEANEGNLDDGQDQAKDISKLKASSKINDDKNKLPEKPKNEEKFVANKNGEPDDTADNPEDVIGNDDIEIENDNDQEIMLPPKNKGLDEGSRLYNKASITEGMRDYSTEMDGDSYFFSYFMVICILFVLGYVVYHNKQKILALILEGRQGKRQYRGRRPNSASYHKLDSNLEEAISSTCNKNTTNVIY